MILTTCSSTSSPNVEFHLHDVLWSRWAGGIHTEVIVMLTQRGMNRQWTATCVSGSLHHWHLQLILTWQGRNDDQEGRSPTAVRTSRDTLEHLDVLDTWRLEHLDLRYFLRQSCGVWDAKLFLWGLAAGAGLGLRFCKCGAGVPALQVQCWGARFPLVSPGDPQGWRPPNTSRGGMPSDLSSRTSCRWIVWTSPEKSYRKNSALTPSRWIISLLCLERRFLK